MEHLCKNYHHIIDLSIILLKFFAFLIFYYFDRFMWDGISCIVVWIGMFFINIAIITILGPNVSCLLKGILGI